MTLRLTGHDERVVGEKLFDERVVFGWCKPTGFRGQLGPKRRVVLGQRMIAFDLERRLSAAHDVVKENGLLDGGDERVADASEHRVVRPHHEGVLTVLAEAPAILLQIFLVTAPESIRPPAGSPSHRPEVTSSSVTTVIGSGCSPAASTRKALWKICIALWVSSVAWMRVMRSRFS